MSIRGTQNMVAIRSSGNQAQCVLRKTAACFKEDYPHIHTIITKDIYMDDCLAGAPTLEETAGIQDDLQYVVSHGGFRFKGFATSGQTPDVALTIDGVHVLAFGTLWDPGKDSIGLNIKEVNFAKKVRGKKSAKIKDVPLNLTKRHCAAKSGEILMVC